MVIQINFTSFNNESGWDFLVGINFLVSSNIILFYKSFFNFTSWY